MIWLILGLTLMFVLGGILAVRPSPGQQRIARLRQHAMEQGLAIKLGRQLKLGTSLDLSYLVAYIRFRPKKLRGCEGQLVLGEDSGSNASGCFKNPRPGLENRLQNLPQGSVLLYSTATEVGVLWDEKGSAEDVDQLAEQLAFLEAWTAG